MFHCDVCLVLQSARTSTVSNSSLNRFTHMEGDQSVNIKTLLSFTLKMLIVAVLAVVAEGTAAAAAAAQRAEKQDSKQDVEVEMTSQSYVTKVAEAEKGYLVVTTSDGQEFKLKDSPELRELSKTVSSKTYSPKNTVPGNCGTSWLYMSGGKKQYRIRTGFRLVRPLRAMAYNWNVGVLGPSPNRIHLAGGLLARDRWSTAFRKRGKPGPYAARVNEGSSALLVGGLVCKSKGPADSDFVK